MARQMKNHSEFRVLFFVTRAGSGLVASQKRNNSREREQCLAFLSNDKKI